MCVSNKNTNMELPIYVQRQKKSDHEYLTCSSRSMSCHQVKAIVYDMFFSRYIKHITFGNILLIFEYHGTEILFPQILSCCEHRMSCSLCVVRDCCL